MSLQDIPLNKNTVDYLDLFLEVEDPIGVFVSWFARQILNDQGSIMDAKKIITKTINDALNLSGSHDIKQCICEYTKAYLAHANRNLPTLQCLKNLRTYFPKNYATKHIISVARQFSYF